MKCQLVIAGTSSELLTILGKIGELNLPQVSAEEQQEAIVNLTDSIEWLRGSIDEQNEIWAPTEQTVKDDEKEPEETIAEMRADQGHLIES